MGHTALVPPFLHSNVALCCFFFGGFVQFRGQHCKGREKMFGIVMPRTTSSGVTFNAVRNFLKTGDKKSCYSFKLGTWWVSFHLQNSLGLIFTLIFVA